MKFRNKLRIISILGLLVFVFILTGCSGKTVKDKQLLLQMNEFLEEIQKTGELQKISDSWYSGERIGQAPDFEGLSGENGVIKIAVKNSTPFVTKTAYSYEGIVADIIYLFCEQYGFIPQIMDFTDTNSMVLSVSTGKCDMGGASVSVTEERQKIIDYSEPYFKNRQVIVVNKEDAQNYEDYSSLTGKRVGVLSGSIARELSIQNIPEVKIYEYASTTDLCQALSHNKIDAIVDDEATLRYAFLSFDNLVITDTLLDNDLFAFIFPKSAQNASTFGMKLLNSLNRTFIQENRWKQLLQGLKCTLLVTIVSIFIGLGIGFLLCLASYKENKIVISLINGFSWIVRGLPTVVLLLIMYYVVFGSSSIDGTVVSIISFSIVFSVTVCGLLNNGIRAIGKGQFEACAALGYKDSAGFLKMILPQVVRFSLPAFKTEVIALIKATSIVGYIAVQDLTKTGDIIRSSTYEAFAPLLVTAVIYFVLAWILTKIVDLIQKAILKHSSLERFLKGVDRHA